MMKFIVAIKKGDYTAEFSFNTREERELFIEETKKMHPTTKFLLSENADWSSSVAKYAHSA